MVQVRDRMRVRHFYIRLNSRRLDGDCVLGLNLRGNKPPGNTDGGHGRYGFNEFGQGDLAVEVAQVGAAGDENILRFPD